MSAPEVLAHSPKTFLERDNWMRAVIASDLPHIVVRLAVRIALHLNIESGRCNPGYDTLASEVRMSNRSVIRIVAMLEHAGWVSVARTGHHEPNQFFLLWGDRGDRGDKVQSPQTPDRGDKAQSPQNTSEVTDSNVRGDKNRESEVTHGVTHKAKRKEKRKEDKEESISPGFASLDLNDPEARGSTLSAAAKTGERKRQAKSKFSEAELAASFEEFYAAYPKHVAREEARRAYAKAIKGGAIAATLIAGAKHYAAERRGQDPKYTKYPATWLNKGCWDDDPSGVPIIDEAGNVVAIEQPQPQQSQRNGFPGIADLLIEEIERDGEWT